MTRNLEPIGAIARKLGLKDDSWEPIGAYGAKVRLSVLDDPAYSRQGKFILVTATTPTVSGEGKTVTSIGLTQGLAHIGKSVVLTSREPSLGPVFGMKGGAAGGGNSQVEPSEKINLHFHGDFHAITSAHNLLSALVDAHLFHGNALGLDPAKITWPRAMDMNDRALRRITVSVGQKDGGPHQREGADRASGFVITAASEVMAILALAADREDLRRRIGAIVVGETRDGSPVRAEDLHATGPMMALLAEALLPNLVQTTDGSPAFVHTGPFGNIAHGTSSVVSHRIALRLADYAVNECGFAADLGFEKYMDIVRRVSGIDPAAAVLVTTAQSLKNQGAAISDDGRDELERGFANLEKHAAILARFGVPTVVAINRFPNDTEEELQRLERWCRDHTLPYARVEAFTRGGEGAAELARAVVRVIDEHPAPRIASVYESGDSPEEKLRKIAVEVYGAAEVQFSAEATAQLDRYKRWGYGTLPVCVAKTQYSLSDDPKLAGAPTGWTLHISSVSLSAGAGFLVAISGNMMLMPGLPKSSRAMDIDVDEHGEIIGLR